MKYIKLDKCSYYRTLETFLQVNTVTFLVMLFSV